jgi:hypothetical protein
VCVRSAAGVAAGSMQLAKAVCESVPLQTGVNRELGSLLLLGDIDMHACAELTFG